MISFTDLFIKRPVLAMVVSFVILIAGSKAILPILFPKLGGLGGLNVRQYPRSDIASISITTVYVGADAELVRGFITTPLERAIAAADGGWRCATGGHPRRSLFCDANLDEARPHGGAQHLAGASPQRTFEKQLSLGDRQHERFASSGKPYGEHRSSHCGRFQKTRR